MRRRRDRLVERRAGYGWVVLLTGLLCAPSLVLGLLLHWDLGVGLTMLGVLLAVATPWLLERRAQRVRPRTVLFVDWRTHYYGNSLVRGLRAELTLSGKPWEVHVWHPDEREPVEPAQQQIETIRSGVLRGADALVILPMVASEALWDEVARAMEAGVGVVMMDVHPPRDRFERSGQLPPFVVSTDYGVGGRLLADAIADACDRDPTRQALLLGGPPGVFAGEERARYCLYELVARGYAERTQVRLLERWSLDAVTVTSLNDELAKSDRPWIVYAGYDGNVLTIQDDLVARYPEARSRVELIGYDCTTDEAQRVAVFDFGKASGTVDVLPEAQGREAARILIESRRDPSLLTSRAVVVRPMWVDRAAYAARLAAH